MPEPLQEPWAYYQRKGLSEMRPYVFKEPLDDISVSAYDRAAILRADSDGPGPGGYIARNPKDHTDQWYVAQAYFDDNLEPVVRRDDKADLIDKMHAQQEGLVKAAKAALHGITYETPRGNTLCRFCRQEIHADHCVAHTLRAALESVGEL